MKKRFPFSIIIEIAEVKKKWGGGEGGCRKDKLPALINVPKKKLLEQTAKVDKV